MGAATQAEPDVLTEDGPRRWRNRGWLVGAGAVVTWLLVGVLRVWFPSVVHVYGDAGSTPAAQMGLFALLWFVPPLLLAVSLRRVGPRPVWRVAVLVLALGRVGLQLTDGGTPQLWLAGVALVGASVALVALAAGSPSGHLVRVGVVLGLGLETTWHAALGTLDLVWRDGVLPGALVAFAVVVAVGVAERAAQVPLWWPSPLTADGDISPVWTRGAARSWLGVGPAIILTGILVSPPARLELAAGFGPRAAVVALAVSTAVAFVAAALAPAFGARLSGTIGAVLVVASTVGALRPFGAVSALAQLTLLVGIGFTLGAPTAPGDSGPRRRGLAAAGSLLLLLVVGFAYYASYEIALPFSNDVFLVVAGVGLGVLALGAARDSKRLRPLRDVPWRALTTTAVVVVVTGAVAAAVVPVGHDAATSPGDGSPVRVAAYNVHAGYDVAGRFDPDALAEVILAEDPDVVVLNEIDRGWLLEGGHDLLRLLAARTGMAATFAPAADDVWGNAIFTRLPIADVTVSPLPRDGVAMARSFVSAVIDAGDGFSFAVVGTHLHHVEEEPAVRLAQARAIAAEVVRLRERGLPVAVLGDLNAAFGAPELAPLDFLVEAIPGDQPTWPADDPVVRLDHILVTPDLAVTEPRIVATTASDHLPLFATLGPG
jgi:endonuclease/exonuclease/phosphatase family metal-dependent hydrolase